MCFNLLCSHAGCPWTLQRPADWQSGAGLQEEVRHLHRACAEREGQRNHGPRRHPPQQGESSPRLGVPAFLIDESKRRRDYYTHWGSQWLQPDVKKHVKA